MPTEDKEAIDIKKEWEELEKLEMERQEINNKLKEYISGITQAIYG
jgi:type I restriction-modification system DNA methylase subunit